jgi:hypothetical protein
MLSMSVSGADDGDGVDIRIADQFVCRGIRLRHVEFLRNAVGERAIGIRDRDHAGFRNARGQIPHVDFAEPSGSNHADFELGHR